METLRASVGENAPGLMAVDSDHGRGRLPDSLPELGLSQVRLETVASVSHLRRWDQRKMNRPVPLAFVAWDIPRTNPLFR